MPIVLGILYYMCTGLAPDMLYNQKASEIESAITNRYSKNLSQLIFDCSRRQRDLRPDACKLYNIAKECYLRSLNKEPTWYSGITPALKTLQEQESQVPHAYQHVELGGRAVAIQGNIYATDYW